MSTNRTESSKLMLVYDIMEFILDQQINLSLRMHKLDNISNKEYCDLAVQTEAAPTTEPTVVVNETRSHGQVVHEKSVLVTSEPMNELTVVENKAVGLDQGQVNLKSSMAYNPNSVNPLENGYDGSDESSIDDFMGDGEYYHEVFSGIETPSICKKDNYSLTSSEIRMMSRDYDCIPKYCIPKDFRKLSLSEISNNNNGRPLIKPIPVGPGGEGGCFDCIHCTSKSHPSESCDFLRDFVYYKGFYYPKSRPKDSDESSFVTGTDQLNSINPDDFDNVIPVLDSNETESDSESCSI